MKIKLLTNSLASQDVPAVDSHYKRWRKPLVKAGVDLYETRPDGAIASTLADTPPAHAEFMGLHVKAMVVDGEPLAQELAGIMGRGNPRTHGR